MKEYLREFDPDVVVLVETRVSGFRANRVVQSIGFSFSHRVEARGFSGGIWILWKANVDMVVMSNESQFVHLKVKFPDLSDWIFFTGVYGNPKIAKRKVLWSSLSTLDWTIQGPWLLSRILMQCCMMMRRKVILDTFVVVALCFGIFVRIVVLRIWVPWTEIHLEPREFV